MKGQARISNTCIDNRHRSSSELLQKGEEELMERRIANANPTTFQNFLGGWLHT